MRPSFLHKLYPRLLMRHTFWRFVAFFGRYAGLFLLLLMMIILLRLHDLIIEFGAAASTVTLLVLLSVPKLLTIVIPFSALLASTSLIQQMSKQNELVIMRQTGLSNGRLLRPILLFGLMLCFLGGLNATVFIPLATQQFNSIKRALNNQDIDIVLKAGKFNYLGNSVMLYTRDIDAQGQYLDIMIVQINDQENSTILAKRGQFNNNLNQPGFLLFDGTVQTLNPKEQVLEVSHFKQFQTQMQPDEIDEISYWISSGERFIPDLLFPDTSNEIDRQRYSALISKGHDRIVSPVYFALLPLFASLLMLLSPFDRHYRTSRIVSVLCLCFGILVIHRMTLNVTASNHQTAGLIYVPVLILLLTILLLWRRNAPLNTDFVGILYHLFRRYILGRSEGALA